MALVSPPGCTDSAATAAGSTVAGPAQPSPVVPKQSIPARYDGSLAGTQALLGQPGRLGRHLWAVGRQAAVVVVVAVAGNRGIGIAARAVGTPVVAAVGLVVRRVSPVLGILVSMVGVRCLEVEVGASAGLPAGCRLR